MMEQGASSEAYEYTRGLDPWAPRHALPAHAWAVWVREGWDMLPG